MRTTLTIDDRLASELKQRALETGKPFKQIVNETLLMGLRRQHEPQPQAYRLKPVSLGTPLGGADLVKALHLADDLEDGAILAKLERRK